MNVAVLAQPLHQLRQGGLLQLLKPLLLQGAGVLQLLQIKAGAGQRMGGGMQIQVADLDGDGDLDLVSGGKSGLHIAENLTLSAASR